MQLLAKDWLAGLFPAQDQPEARVLVELGIGLRIQEFLEEAFQIGVCVLEGEHHDRMAPNSDAFVLLDPLDQQGHHIDRILSRLTPVTGDRVNREETNLALRVP